MLRTVDRGEFPAKADIEMVYLVISLKKPLHTFVSVRLHILKPFIDSPTIQFWKFGSFTSDHVCRK
jgi:hypothetical protein